MSCANCDDTGSTSKWPAGFLDCTHCDVAEERVQLEKWAANRSLLGGGAINAWEIYQHGKDVAAESAK